MKWWTFNLAFFSATCCLAQPPPNDLFENRIHLSGSEVTFGGSLQGASWGEDPCEPCLSYVCGESRWWSWIPQQSSAVIIEKVGEYQPENGGFSVFTGTNLCELRNNRICEIDLRKRGQYVTFCAQAGTEYQFFVVGPWSATFYFRLTATNTPMFRLQPSTQAVSSYGSTIFSALAIGIPPLRYQWSHCGADMPNATNRMISFDNIVLADAGEYCVVVTNATGVCTSQIAKLVVSTNDTSPILAAHEVVGGNRFHYTVTGQRGRKYRAEFSTDLKSWGGGVIFNTNETTSFFVNRDVPSKFERLSIYHAANEVCVNNLRQIRSAIWMCAEENHLLDQDAIGPGFHGLDDYMIDGRWPPCPSAIGVYTNFINYTMADVVDKPTCWVVPDSHILENP
jgi:hypothetical protein